MSNDLTTGQKREALEAAGKRIKKNATAEEIDMAFLEWEVEQEEAANEGRQVRAEPVGDPETSDPAPFGPDGERGESGIPAQTSEVPSANATGETLADVMTRVRAKVLAENVRDYAGDKDPEVLAWARANMSRDEFELHYGSRASFTA